jgi:hypothetical protein
MAFWGRSVPDGVARAVNPFSFSCVSPAVDAEQLVVAGTVVVVVVAATVVEVVGTVVVVGYPRWTVKLVAPTEVTVPVTSWVQLR